MQTIFKKCPFKENGELSKLFRLILRDIRPHSSRSCGVSDPAELSLAGVSDPAEQWQRWVYVIADACSVGSDTPKNNILRGLILRRKKSCGVSDPAEQSSAGYHTLWKNFKYEYFREFETEFKNILGCEFGDQMGSIHGKKTRARNSCATVPLRVCYQFQGAVPLKPQKNPEQDSASSDESWRQNWHVSMSGKMFPMLTTGQLIPAVNRQMLQTYGSCAVVVTGHWEILDMVGGGIYR
jgi:hypothetical protein